MAQLSDFPLELQLMILQHCSLRTCRAILLVSKPWYHLGYHAVLKLLELRVKTAYYPPNIGEAKSQLTLPELFKILSQYKLEALEESALLKEPDGEAYNMKLQAIHESQASIIDKQQQFETLASESAIYVCSLNPG